MQLCLGRALVSQTLGQASMTSTTDLPPSQGNEVAARAARRLAHEQALASTRIEGHQPSAAFLADWEAIIEGTMTHDEARLASLARALGRLA